MVKNVIFNNYAVLALSFVLKHKVAAIMFYDSHNLILNSIVEIIIAAICSETQ